MKSLIKLAWRNIWRNKRRTIITAASIFFAVTFALIMRAYQLGTYGHWTKGIVESYTGYIQIHANGYWNNKIIDNTFKYTDSLRNKVMSIDNVTDMIPRLESGGLASYKNNTKVAIVFGVDPELENDATNLKDKLVKYRITDKTMEALREAEAPDTVMHKMKDIKNASYAHVSKFRFEVKYTIGNEYSNKYFETIKDNSEFTNSYFDNSENQVLIADRLSKYLDIQIGDSLVILGSGYHGVTAAGLYQVKGILKFPAPDMDKSMVYLPLKTAQTLYSAPNMLSSLAIYIDNKNELQETKQQIADKINTKNTIEEKTESYAPEKFTENKYEVMDWKELNELIMKQIEADNVSGLIMLGLLYMIIAFGIFGTVLMMTTERKREFGVMVAVGMQKLKLGGIVTIEMIFIGTIGILSGTIASLPIIYYFHVNPVRLGGEMAASIESFGMEAVMPMAWEPNFFINQAAVIVFIVILASFYPVYSITRIKVINALRA